MNKAAMGFWCVLGVVLAGITTAHALDGKNGYVVGSELTWADAEDVTIGSAPGLTYNNSRPCMAFTDDGDGFVLAVSGSLDSTDTDWPSDIYYWHELIRFTPGVSNIHAQAKEHATVFHVFGLGDEITDGGPHHVAVELAAELDLDPMGSVGGDPEHGRSPCVLLR